MATIILENHSVHKSMETMAYLSSRSFRFKFVFTSTFALWFKIIETFFGMTSGTMLKVIVEYSKEELNDRVISYIVKTNTEATVLR